MSLAPHRQLVLDGSKSRRAMPINNPPTAASFCPDGSGHHWIIDTPAGALSDGVCKKCGAERAFRTSSDENTRAERWYEDIDHTAAAAAKRASMDLTRALSRMRKPS